MQGILELLIAVVCFILIEIAAIAIWILLTPSDSVFLRRLVRPFQWVIDLRKKIRKDDTEENAYQRFAHYLFDTEMPEEMANAISVRLFDSLNLIAEENSCFLELYSGFLQGILTPKDEFQLRVWAEDSGVAETLFRLAPSRPSEEDDQ